MSEFPGVTKNEPHFAGVRCHSGHGGGLGEEGLDALKVVPLSSPRIKLSEVIISERIGWDRSMQSRVSHST